MSTTTLRDSLLALATPQPKKLPPALAGLFPVGCFLRARTAKDDVDMEASLEANKLPDAASNYEKGLRAIFIALSYSLCDDKGELVAPGEFQHFYRLPHNAVPAIQKELETLMKGEQVEQGKD